MAHTMFLAEHWYRDFHGPPRAIDEFSVWKTPLSRGN